MKNALVFSHLLEDYHLNTRKNKDKAVSMIIGLDPTLSHNQACQKMLTHHFTHFLKYEALVMDNGYDVDSDVIHDMRVTVRRIESILRIFQFDFKLSLIKLLKNSLKNIMHRLSLVRDLDVFMKNLKSYQSKLSRESAIDEDENSAFLPLIAYFKSQRKRAMKKIITLLQGKDHVKFKEKIDHYLVASFKNTKMTSFHKNSPYKIRHIAFSSIYKCYEVIRIRDELLKNASIEQLHDFRKDCKNLRYLLENFQEILGKESIEALAEMKKIQDYLGDLNDTEVALDFLHYYLAHDENLCKQSVPHPIANYLSEVENKQKLLLDGFPVFWHQVNTPKLRRHLALAIAEL